MTPQVQRHFSRLSRSLRLPDTRDGVLRGILPLGAGPNSHEMALEAMPSKPFADPYASVPVSVTVGALQGPILRHTRI